MEPAGGEPGSTAAFPVALPLPDTPTAAEPPPAATGPAPTDDPKDARDGARREALQAYCHARAADPYFAPHADVVFERMGVLGEGGMGVVERVLDRRLDRQAALKVMRDPHADPAAVRRFRREAEVTAHLDHPSIPPVYEAGTDARGRHYLLMRVIEGEPLSAILRERHGRGGAAPPYRDLLEALVKVGEAVAYAHAQGIVHRDLKPHNVIVGRFGEVMVVDWGLARDVRARGDEPAPSPLPRPVAEHDSDLTLTEAGAVLGTPGYMAPEQARGERVDERADVFALGALLCEVLTGRAPVAGATALNRIVAAQQGRVTTPRQLRGDVPPELEAIAARALAADAAARLPTAEAFVADLRAYLSGGEVRSHRYRAAERVQRWARRHPTLLVGAAVAGVLLSAGAVQGVRLREAARSRQAALEAQARLEASLDLLARAEDRAYGGADVAVVRSLIMQALGSEPTPFLLWNAARVYDEAGMVEEARAALERTVEEHPPALRELLYLHRLELREAPGLNPASSRTPWLVRLFAESARVEPDNPFALLARANAAFVASDLTTARALCERVVAEQGRWSWALNDRGVIRRACGDLAGAADDYRRAIELEPREGIYHLNLSITLRDLGRMSEALEHGTRAVERMPRSVQARLHLAGLLHRGQEYARAVVELDRTIALAPGEGRLHSDRAASRLAAGDAAGAVADCERALELDPTLWSAYVNRASARLQLGDNDLARVDLDRALEQAPDEFPHAWAMRARVRMLAGDHRGGFEDFDRAVALAPDDASWVNDRGRARLELGDWAGARADLDRAVLLDPRLVLAYANRAIVRCEQGDVPGGLEDARLAVSLEPRSAAGYAARAHARVAAGDPQGAVSDASRAIDLSPRDPFPLVARARAWAALGDFRTALVDYDAAVSVSAPAASLLANRAQTRLMLRDVPGAIEDCTRALALEPGHLIALLNRALAREMAADLDAALADFDRALALHPRSSEGFYMRGNARQRRGDAEGALADWARATELEPGFANAWFNRGLMALQLGRPALAVESLDRALALEANAKTHLGRSRARAALGDVEGAIADLEAAVRLDPHRAEALADELRALHERKGRRAGPR